MKKLKLIAQLIPIIGTAIDNYDSNGKKINWQSLGRSLLRLAGEVAATVYAINQL
jgi:hypothetical protein